MERKMAAALLAVLLVFSLTGCGTRPDGADTAQGGSTPESTQNGSRADTTQGGCTSESTQDGSTARLPFQGSDGWDFQKNMNQSAFGSMGELCKAETGYYFQFGDTLYYLEGAAGRVTELCAKPDCAHENGDCNAWAGAFALWYSGGRLYFARRDFEKRGESFTELGKHVYAVDPDGTGRRQVMSLELQPVRGRPLSSFDNPICHRGQVYFVYNGALYAVPLEGDAGEAERIWGEDYSAGGGEGGYTAYDPNEPHYTLWADGETVYFMLTATQENGARNQTLYAVEPAAKSVKKVWEVPDGNQVGPWETTGVSVSQWYVLNGTIYFYLSGGDFWKTDLAHGETVKVADTHEKTLYGTAVFSDEYMCLLNEHPMIDPATGEPWPEGGFHEGGDTVYVYRLDGTLMRELPLGGLWDTLGEIESFYPVFCDGDALYLIADAGRMVPIPGGAGSQKSRLDALCRVDLETGAIREITRWEDWT